MREKLGSNGEDCHRVPSENVLAKMLWPELAMPHPCVLGYRLAALIAPLLRIMTLRLPNTRKQPALSISARVIYSHFLHRAPLQSQGLPPHRTAFQHPGEPGADGGNDAMAPRAAVR